MTLFDRWKTVLEDLRAECRYRNLDEAKGVDFSSNDYLGFGAEAFPIISADGESSLPRSGMASRLLRGEHKIWRQVESVLADWHDAEAALIFNSGYVANEGLLTTLLEAGDVVFSDQLNHASIIDGLRLSRAERIVFRHNDCDHLEESLRRASGRRSGQFFVVTESLFGMDGDRAPLVELTRLCQSYNAHLIVDEAHATGCFGAQGSGIVDELGLRDDILATIHTGGKALGVPGAYVCGSALLKEYLVNRCRHFIFTTALPPMIGMWWLKALYRVPEANERRAHLHQAVAHFRHELLQHGIAASGDHYIIPVILGNDDEAVEAASHLQDQGYDIRAIRPPTVPPGTARLRISVHADHDFGLLSEVAAAVAHTTHRCDMRLS